MQMNAGRFVCDSLDADAEKNRTEIKWVKTVSGYSNSRNKNTIKIRRKYNKERFRLSK